jgi:hypothetical protein
MSTSILVAADDPATRELLSEYLALADCRVLSPDRVQWLQHGAPAEQPPPPHARAGEPALHPTLVRHRPRDLALDEVWSYRDLLQVKLLMAEPGKGRVSYAYPKRTGEDHGALHEGDT